MKTLLSLKFPNLMSINPRVQFHEGRATVADEEAAVLLSRTALGIVLAEDDAEVAEQADRSDSAEVVPEKPSDTLPSARASVKTWVEFMEAQGITHPEDATRAEMRALAETHFAGRDDRSGATS